MMLRLNPPPSISESLFMRQPIDDENRTQRQIGEEEKDEDNNPH
jgi:hypothetical protein